jgi:hypothetical protein
VQVPTGAAESCPSALDLVRRILVSDPAQRCTLPVVMQHPWFQVRLFLGVDPGFERGTWVRFSALICPTEPRAWRRLDVARRAGHAERVRVCGTTSSAPRRSCHRARCSSMRPTFP